VIRSKRVAVAALLAGIACLGCGPGGPEIARVEGKITMDGKPLANAAVIFIPENGRPAGATTDSEGNYVLTFTEGRKGATPGKHRVRITTLRDASETPDGQPIPASPERVPAQYNNQSKLEFTVEPGKTNVANFDITSEGQLPEPDIF
jgi:hypothetical protein